MREVAQDATADEGDVVHDARRAARDLDAVSGVAGRPGEPGVDGGEAADTRRGERAGKDVHRVRPAGVEQRVVAEDVLYVLVGPGVDVQAVDARRDVALKDRRVAAANEVDARQGLRRGRVRHDHAVDVRVAPEAVVDLDSDAGRDQNGVDRAGVDPHLERRALHQDADHGVVHVHALDHHVVREVHVDVCAGRAGGGRENLHVHDADLGDSGDAVPELDHVANEEVGKDDRASSPGPAEPDVVLRDRQRTRDLVDTGWEEDLHTAPTNTSRSRSRDGRLDRRPVVRSSVAERPVVADVDPGPRNRRSRARVHDPAVAVVGLPSRLVQDGEALTEQRHGSSNEVRGRHAVDVQGVAGHGVDRRVCEDDGLEECLRSTGCRVEHASDSRELPLGNDAVRLDTGDQRHTSNRVGDRRASRRNASD